MANGRFTEIRKRVKSGSLVNNFYHVVGRDFLKLVLIANIIFWPVAYYFMNNWLQDFAYMMRGEVMTL